MAEVARSMAGIHCARLRRPLSINDFGTIDIAVSTCGTNFPLTAAQLIHVLWRNFRVAQQVKLYALYRQLEWLSLERVQKCSAWTNPRHKATRSRRRKGCPAM
ncbi:hypothetical protein SBA3_1120004 [Candidatus Sulfopaludibacter sp. SbA3]|nr:hypothetical protein SBA3_1120004 [Candidatus Sulfopaludibacter sp. SbA3]